MRLLEMKFKFKSLTTLFKSIFGPQVMFLISDTIIPETLKFSWLTYPEIVLTN